MSIETSQQYEDWYWLNEESLAFLRKDYLLPGVTTKERIRQIAENAEKILNKPGFADRFYHHMKKGHFSLSSPIWANFGLVRALDISCFGSVVEDSIEGIMDTVAEIGVMNKHGGGTSAYFGHVRPRGSIIKDNGKSNGSFEFLNLFEATVNVVSQGNVRRGMMAAWQDIEHADVEEWLNIHTEGNPIQQIYYGIAVGDKWLDEMKAGDKYKRNIWAKIIQRRTETGIPYLMFRDNVNNDKPQVYKDKNLQIHASNMCVTGDTCILTLEYGNIPMERIVGQKVTVWNGKEWSKDVEIVKTGENQEVYRVTFDNGEHIDATGYHKWYIQDANGNVEMKRTTDLEKGDKTEDYLLPPNTSGTVLADSHVVVDVYKLSELYDTYCCTEPKRNKVIFNGVLTGNCNEIALPSNEDESFVCCLSSLNLLHYDNWKDTDAVEVLTYFLDAVMEEFIQKAKHIKHLERAVRFSEKHRALGIGVLGWHSYLQSKMIPFDSFAAMQLNNQIFRLIQEKATKASREMAEIYGEPELLKGYGLRNTTLTAIAPTKSSSFILGQVSPSIEPYKSNYYVKDLAKAKTVFKNPYLEKLLQEKGLDTPDIWKSILDHAGSVQHLTQLTQEEKDVFKTFEEISQLVVIQQAAQRQRYIDQGQSINVMIHPKTSAKDINQLYLTAHELGVKGLYYQFSSSAAQEFNRSLLTGCTSCEA